MPTHLDLMLRGTQIEAAAAELEAALSAGGAPVSFPRRPVEPMAETPHRAVDPVTVGLTALMLSIPSVLLTVLNLADRIGKRKKAQALVETAQRLQIELKVQVVLVTPEGERPLETLTADQLLELASQAQDDAP